LRIHPPAPGWQRPTGEAVRLEGKGAAQPLQHEEEIEMTANKRLGDADEIREQVREGYTRVAQRDTGCCGAVSSEAGQSAQRAGYSEEELQVVPEGSNLGVGCGNPTALASLRPGEVVLDLGSGAGFDAFLVARAVGPTGRVIGVDMTDAMLEKARENARKGGFANVEFRKGTIEDLPLVSGAATRRQVIDLRHRPGAASASRGHEQPGCLPRLCGWCEPPEGVSRDDPEGGIP
jgi:16S rRNA C967 or C1407 C5-methylase (RsmB/RsmF family)